MSRKSRKQAPIVTPEEPVGTFEDVPTTTVEEPVVVTAKSITIDQLKAAANHKIISSTTKEVRSKVKDARTILGALVALHNEALSEKSHQFALSTVADLCIKWNIEIAR